MAIKIAGVDVINDDRELVLAKLTDINSTISSTASDVFVYDTSKDSDGGAWRHRTQHTSWYNEGASSTRGSRKEFPAVAVIVVEADGPVVTIYDGDDPSLPMWMVANVRGQDTTNYGFTALGGQSGYLDSTAALDGKLCFGGSGGYSTQGVLVWDFLADTFGNYANNSVYSGITAGTIADRNTIQLVTQSLPLIVLSIVNDVAMTVLPDAPTDPATGIAVPTIAIGTAGGVSVIRDDGTVVDIAEQASDNECEHIGFDEENRLVYHERYSPTSDSHIIVFDAIPSADTTVSAADAVYAHDQKPHLTPTDDINGYVLGAMANNGRAFSILEPATQGISQLHPDPTTPANGMVAYTTSSYTTGWMNGDIKLAALADTTAETLSGTPLLDDDFSSGTTGWTFEGTATDTSTAGFLSGTAGGTTNLVAYQVIPTVAGKTYVLEVTTGPAQSAIYVSSVSPGAAELGTSGHGTSATLATTFVATGTTTYISAMSVSGFANASIDNVSVRLADPDRSVNGNGIGVHGSITKAAVATGADVVGYSGFSGSNYLEQPYNSDLDFGTGDFCVMGWFKAGSLVSNQTLVSKHDGVAGTLFQLNTFSGVIHFYSSGWKSSGYSPSVGVWEQIVVKREAGTLYIYVNGSLEYSVASTDNYTLSNATTLFGINHNKTWPLLSGGSLALWRISATAPTADQIKKIYEDEKVLFQEGAKATLYGSSDAVTALAHDPVTDLLHVGTSSGRSVFQGLRRVEESTGTDSQSLAAISAVDGLVVEGK